MKNNRNQSSKHLINSSMEYTNILTLECAESPKGIAKAYAKIILDYLKKVLGEEADVDTIYFQLGDDDDCPTCIDFYAKLS